MACFSSSKAKHVATLTLCSALYCYDVDPLPSLPGGVPGMQWQISSAGRKGAPLATLWAYSVSPMSHTATYQQWHTAVSIRPSADLHWWLRGMGTEEELCPHWTAWKVAVPLPATVSWLGWHCNSQPEKG